MIIATDQSGIVRTFNHAAERMLGWRADEVVGCQTPVSWIAPSELESWIAELSYEQNRLLSPESVILEAMAQKGGSQLRGCTMTRKDSSSFSVSLTVTKKLDVTGQFSGYVITGLAAETSPLQAGQEQLQTEKMRA